MLPPLDPAVVSSNPKFEALYHDLTTTKLCDDATSRLDAKAQKERDALGEELRKARTESARKILIKNGLRDLAYTPDALPEAMQELVAVVAAMLEGQIAEDDRLLLQDDLMTFKKNITPISTALSKIFIEDGRQITAMLPPDDQPILSDLPKSISHLKDSIAVARNTSAQSRVSLAHEATELHVIYRQITELSIRILEQSMHGSVARGTKAKADYLATVAEGMSKKLELQHGQLVGQLYSGDVRDALRTRSEQLAKEMNVVKGKVRTAEGKMDEYSRASGMKGMAGEYAEILGESERVRGEIERLKGGKA